MTGGLFGAWSAHLIILPIVAPLIMAAALLLVSERRNVLKAALSLAATVVMLAVAGLLLFAASTGEEGAQVYHLGNWVAPYGIVLVADRLTALMLILTAVLGLGSLIFAMARWDRAGPRFHALFLLLLMGVNGAFLTGDLFNLFVFFEIMLAASYGLLLHGSGETRIRAALGYIAINLTASMCFLVGVSLIYGVAGTLNMADLATRIADIAPADRRLLEIGCAILAVAFLVKASLWPLGFWLPGTYAAASAPVAAVFAILSKVGVYIVIRLSLLLFGADAGASAGFGSSALLVMGAATIVFGTAGILASRSPPRAVGYAVMISSGTILAVVGVGGVEGLSAALFYLVASTLAAGALFLTVEIMARGEDSEPVAALAVFDDEYRDPFDDDDIDEEGLIIPVSIALMGGAFLLCVLLVAGMPPLAGFIGKLAIFTGLLADQGVGSAAAWMLIGLLTFSSFGVLVTLVKFGVESLWAQADRPTPVIKAPEFIAVAGLLGVCVALSIWGAPVLTYADRTAEWLSRPAGYVDAVLGDAP